MFLVSEISTFIRTEGQTDMARLTRPLILIGNEYIVSNEFSIPFYSLCNVYNYIYNILNTTTL